jgi:hypothetical protein
VLRNDKIRLFRVGLGFLSILVEKSYRFDKLIGKFKGIEIEDF